MADTPHADRLVAAFRNRTDPIVGFRAAFPYLPAVELVAATGVDYVYLDRQHGPIGLDDIWTICAAMARHDLLVLVRISQISHQEMGAVLDAGAHGVIVPDISTPAQASDMLAAMQHPPRGTRSWGAYAYDSTGYGGPAGRLERPLYLPMIESAEGLENVEAIAALDGVDALYVGRNDLALSLGTTDSTHPSVADGDAIARIRAAADAAGIPMATTGVKSKLLAEGYRMVTLGSELDFVRRGLMAAQEA